MILFSSSWAAGEPNNSGGSSTSILEGCGEISDNGFNDLSCSTYRYYICEIQI